MLDDVKLQPHQQEVRNHITKTCCKQPGIVLYHAVGSGKTLTALAIVAAMPEDVPCVVFSPDEVMFMWRAELRRFGMTRRVGVFSHKELGRKTVKGHMVIIDEAHIWIQWLHSPVEAVRARAARAYKNMRKASHRIVMTGSPICNPLRGIYDIACLCNLATGQEMFQFSQPAFLKKYTSIDVFQSVVSGWGLGLGAAATSVMSGAAASKLTAGGWDHFSKTLNPLTSVGRMLMHRMTYVLGIGIFLTWFVSQHLDRAATLSTTKFVNASKFWSDAGSLVSYFDPRHTSPDFPKVTVHRVSAPLTMEQHMKWWEIANRLVDDKNLKKLGIHDNGASRAWSSFISSAEEYLVMARRVAIFTSDESPPKKYTNVLRLMRESKHGSIDRCVVYSELAGGVHQFQKYLDEEHVKTALLSETLTDARKEEMLKKFEEGSIPVLLLSKNMYFGFTIKGARQLHVLEPIFDGATREQLYGRVNRYKSHAHLPLGQRNVDIYVHVGTLSENLIRDQARRMIVAFRQYMKHDTHKAWGFAAKQRGAFDMTFTPDEVIWKLSEASNDKSVLTGSVTVPCPDSWSCCREKRSSSFS